MLNTDLHHPQITKKISPEEFLRSVRRTILGDAFSQAEIFRIYENIAINKLLICPPLQQVNLKTQFSLSSQRQPDEISSTASNFIVAVFFFLALFNLMF